MKNNGCAEAVFVGIVLVFFLTAVVMGGIGAQMRAARERDKTEQIKALIKENETLRAIIGLKGEKE